MRRFQLAAALLLLAWIQQACKSGPEARPNVSYKVSAQENFLKGKKAYENKDYLEAIEYLNFVRTKFPFTTYAADADVLVADCEYAREKFVEAADAYTNFIKLHPKHPKVPYASFRVGMCYYNRIPDDWFFLPPVYEMDQDETDRAVRELDHYLKQYAQDENVPEAKKAMEKCQTRLAERVRYVMNFYYKRDKYRGVVWRANQLLAKYAGLGFDEEALYRKGQSLVQLGEAAEARTALEQLLQKFPNGDYASKAKDLLAELPAANAPPTQKGSTTR